MKHEYADESRQAKNPRIRAPLFFSRTLLLTGVIRGWLPTICNPLTPVLDISGIITLMQRTNVVDLPRMIEIVLDHH